MGTGTGLPRFVTERIRRLSVCARVSLLRRDGTAVDRLVIPRAIARVRRRSDVDGRHRRPDMNLLQLPWLELAIGTAMSGSAFVSRLRDPNRAYRWGLAFMGTSFICTLSAWLAFYIGIPNDDIAHHSFQPRLFGRMLFSLDELSAPLVPTVALLHVLTALATARTKMRRYSFSWSLAAAAIRLATFSCEQPWVLVGLLASSTVPPYVELVNRRRPTRVYTIHMALFVTLLVAGWGAVESAHGDIS